MDKLTNWVEQAVVPKVSRITSLRYFQALRNGFFAIMPLTIIGSIFMLITDFPVAGYGDFMAGIFGAGWADMISPAYRATFNMMGIIFAGTMSYKLAESYEMDRLTSLILGIVAYVVVLPKTVTTESGEVVTKVLSFDWLGTQGVITAIIMSILSVELTRFCIKKKLVIKMPDSVPSMVSQAFSALIPGIFVVAVALLINGIGLSFADSFPQLIYAVIQAPLQGLIGTPFAIIIVAGLNGLFWWFGIHPTVINSMLYPILYGCTIGLAIAMAIVGHSSRMKAMSKISFVPAFFNINEPLIFGLPVIFNPLLLIPIAVAPIVSVLIAFLSMKIGFMPMFTNIQAPWATPFLFSGFLVGKWQGAVTQVLAVAASVVIYYPFVKALDRQYQKEEAHEVPETL